MSSDVWDMRASGRRNSGRSFTFNTAAVYLRLPFSGWLAFAPRLGHAA